MQLTDVEEEPRACGAHKSASILPAPVMTDKITPARLGNSFDAVVSLDLNALHLIGLSLTEALDVSLNVHIGLERVTRDIQSVTRGLRDGPTEVQSYQSW